MTKLKEVSFLITGALLSLVFVPYENSLRDNLVWVVVGMLFFLLIGLGFLDRIYFLWALLRKKINELRKIICIYAPNDIDSETSSWVNLSLRELLASLKKEKIRFKVIKKQNRILYYPLVLNPYGGVYPEKNLSTFHSLDFIFKYVRNGGFYLNIADIPFYYAFDASLQRRVDTTPLAGDFSQIRSFLQTILTKKLHCFVYATNNDQRIISLSKTSRNFDTNSINQDGVEYSQRLAIPYGRGYFIFSTKSICNDNINVLIEVIKKCKKML